MKKVFGIATVIALFSLVFIGCASTDVEETASTAEAPVEVSNPTESVELVYGEDYILEPVFGDAFSLMDTTIAFYPESANNNHAILFRFLDPYKIQKDYTITINYTMGEYDPSISAQLCIQPADDNNADYGNQSYPILYNNFEEENTFSITIDCNKLLKSSVNQGLVGFRMVNNTGAYEKFTWQSEYDFTINSVILNPPM